MVQSGFEGTFIFIMCLDSYLIILQVKQHIYFFMTSNVQQGNRLIWFYHRPITS